VEAAVACAGAAAAIAEESGHGAGGAGGEWFSEDVEIRHGVIMGVRRILASGSTCVFDLAVKFPAWVIGEFLGTFLLVFFGCGSVCVAVVTDVEMSLWQVALVWGVGVAVAIYATSSLSGAHLNPAVTLALAVFRGFERRRVLGYFGGQLLGAFCAAAVLQVIFGGAIEGFEKGSGIVRGEAGSEASAMVYGEYFPNPEGEALSAEAKESVSTLQAFLIEVGGTGVLVLVVFWLTRRKRQKLNPVWIGLTVAGLIVVLAPFTQGCFNPARDFGPRVFSALAGWGEIPFTTNGEGWWLVYIVAPLCGGLVGAGLWRLGCEADRNVHAP